MPSLPSIPSTGTPLDSATSGTNSLLNAATGVKGQNSNVSPTPPWVLPYVKTLPRFFFPVTIDATRWNLAYPYRLVVIDTTKGNAIVNGPASNAQVTVSNMNSSGVLTFTPLSQQWVVQLPITPDQLHIADLFAINVSATLRGILEEHNGVKFKNISAAGTFGVWQDRAGLQNPQAPPGSPSIVQSLFGGTIEAFGNEVGSIQRLINTATTGHPANKPVTKQPGAQGVGAPTSTGYFQALAVEQFLEQYAEQKKNPANAGWRLIFDIPKQNQSFVITPGQFIWQQSVNKPMEIRYTFQAKAWRRIDLNETINTTPPSVQPITPGILQRVLNTIAAARQVCSSSLNLIAAVRSDVEAPLEALRQTSLFVKDLAGVVISAADLPAQLQSDFKSAINQFTTSLSFNNLTGQAGSNSSVQSTLSGVQASAQQNEGLSIAAVASGQLGSAASNAQSINPANNAYSSPEANFLLMDQVPLNSLILSSSQQDSVNTAVEAARALTVADLKQFRATIQQLALQLSNSFGTGSAYYNQVYGLPAPSPSITPISLDNYEFLNSLYDTMQSYDILTSTTTLDDQTIQTNMEYVAGLASNAGIPFILPNSMILAPVPFGLTIEGIAARYLGDPQRWIEIVTLNNLKDPYIDESGFQYELLSNGDGRQITVGSDFNLFLGQIVTLYSATQTPSPRTILDIKELSPTSFLITLDGPPNLDAFLTTDSAYLQAYLPGTVNSQQKIFIPSDITVPDNPTIVVPASTSSDPLTGMSGVDLLLTDTGDLAVNNFGDFRYSYGLTNIIQALKIKMGTFAGTVLLHPEFGFGVRPGTSNADITAQQLYRSINRSISQDPRFTGLAGLQVTLNGPTLTVNMAVQLANQKGVFPITFKVTPNSAAS
jgi:hypothetical protein